MRKLNINQSGFSVVEGVIVLVVIAAIVTCGWWVAHSRSAKKTTASATPSQSTANAPTANNAAPAPEPAIDVYAGWQAYSGHGFSLKYPQNWKSLDTLGTRTDLSDVVFGTQVVSAQGGLVPNTSGFEVKVYHAGYVISDVPSERVDASTDVTHFVRALNGLLPADTFSKATKNTKTIAGKEAISFRSNGVDTPWAFKVGTNIYSIEELSAKDISKTTLDDYFDKFIKSFSLN